MNPPLQITIRDTTNTPGIEARIRTRAAKLSHYFDRILNVRVVVEVPQKHKLQGKLFNVRLSVSVPGRELIVNHRLYEDLYIGIRDAFNAMYKQLESYREKMRQQIKHHPAELSGTVVRLNAEERYGFILGVSGEEYYFHETNVIHPTFNQLTTGMKVHFIQEVANDGWQAHRVTIAE